MNQKRVQGSHFANLKQASAANQLMLERRLDPCMSEVFPWAQIPEAHVKMRRNEHKPGNMAVLVSAPTTGLRTFADTVEASRARGLIRCAIRAAADAGGIRPQVESIRMISILWLARALTISGVSILVNLTKPRAVVTTLRTNFRSSAGDRR